MSTIPTRPASPTTGRCRNWPLASPGQRAGLISASWIVFYLAFSVPILIAGVAVTHFGLHRTAVVYSAALAVLAAAAAGSFLSHRRSPPSAPDPAAAQAPLG